MALVLFLAGCGKDAPVLIGLNVAPPECYLSHDEKERQKRDPRWQPLPDEDVTRSKAARNYRTNKDRFRELERLRDICDAGLRG
jgi:hypothetical protein